MDGGGEEVVMWLGASFAMLCLGPSSGLYQVLQDGHT